MLYSLKAINLNGDLTTDIGSKLAELPVEPRLGVLLINSGIFIHQWNNLKGKQNSAALKKSQCWFLCSLYKISSTAMRINLSNKIT